MIRGNRRGRKKKIREGSQELVSGAAENRGSSAIIDARPRRGVERGIGK